MRRKEARDIDWRKKKDLGLMRRSKTRSAPTNHRPSFPQPISPSLSQSLRGCSRPQNVALHIYWPSPTRSDGRQWSAPVERRKLPRLQAPAKSPAPCVLCEIAAGQGSADPAIGGRLRRRGVFRRVIGCLSPGCGAGVEQVSQFGKGECVPTRRSLFWLGDARLFPWRNGSAVEPWGSAKRPGGWGRCTGG